MPSKKLNLRDRLEDNELDLSMSDLEEVPVRDIALIKKATSIDLSNNRLSILKDNFATLTHITKLDLSKNQLSSLPENFGDLILLKHLDLYHNKLTHLPLGLGQLKSLRWLDLKDNPLVPVLAEIAGPCIDPAQCHQCARKVVLFLQEMKEKVDKRKQEIIEKGRKEQEVLVQKKEEVKKKKKLTKSEKKKENGVKGSQSVVATGDSIAKKNHNNVKPTNQHSAQPVGIPQKKKQPKPTQRGSFCGKFLKFLRFFLFVTAIALIMLRVTNREKFDSLHRVVGKGWDSFVLLLPTQVVTSGRQVAEVARPTLNFAWTQFVYLGNLTAIKVQEGYSWLKVNENSQHFVLQAESMWAVLCERASELYRTVSELTVSSIENVKKSGI